MKTAPYDMAPGAYDDPLHEWAISDTESGLTLGFWITFEDAAEYRARELGGDEERYPIAHRNQLS